MRLPRPDKRAALDTMPGSDVPVIRQPFDASDHLPFWASRHFSGNHLFDVGDDPAEQQQPGRLRSRSATRSTCSSPPSTRSKRHASSAFGSVSSETRRGPWQDLRPCASRSSTRPTRSSCGTSTEPSARSAWPASRRRSSEKGAEMLARSVTYSFAAFGVKASGASAGINAKPDGRDAAVARVHRTRSRRSPRQAPWCCTPATV